MRDEKSNVKNTPVSQCLKFQNHAFGIVHFPSNWEINSNSLNTSTKYFHFNGYFIEIWEISNNENSTGNDHQNRTIEKDDPRHGRFKKIVRIRVYFAGACEQTQKFPKFGAKLKHLHFHFILVLTSLIIQIANCDKMAGVPPLYSLRTEF